MNETDLIFSPQYSYVRCRQLEGTFPGDRWTGTWVVTAMRIGHGWGSLPEEFWPYDTTVWPPVEPSGLDSIAKEYRLNTYYRRVRTVEECKNLLCHMPVMLALTIADDWYDAAQGRISQVQRPSIRSGSHSILLVGYNDQKNEFVFQNSWGIKWGDNGFGYLPYDVFRETCIESWAEIPGGSSEWSQPKSGAAYRSWGVREFTGAVVHGHEITGPGEERIAWAYAVEQGNALEVEELFVMPQFRRQRYGSELADGMARLAAKRGALLKFWISHADAVPENLAIVEGVIWPLGLHFEASRQPWASYVCTK